jgi:hypothetical protein
MNAPGAVPMDVGEGKEHWKAATKASPVLALGIEGSANKLGVGIVKYDGEEFTILSNPRKTFITPPGQGFLPRETAWHHQAHVAGIVRCALDEAAISPAELTCICYTMGESGVRRRGITVGVGGWCGWVWVGGVGAGAGGGGALFENVRGCGAQQSPVFPGYKDLPLSER